MTLNKYISQEIIRSCGFNDYEASTVFFREGYDCKFHIGGHIKHTNCENTNIVIIESQIWYRKRTEFYFGTIEGKPMKDRDSDEEKDFKTRMLGFVSRKHRVSGKNLESKLTPFGISK